jgi:hypothetical protein
MKLNMALKVEIEVVLARLEARAPLRALADVKLRWPENELTIRRCAVFEKVDEPPWISLPKLSIEKNGKRIYVPLIDLSRDLKQQVLDAILAEYRKGK